jgi:DNA-binding response OmpR family regulator
LTVTTRPLIELPFAVERTRSSPFFNFFALLRIGLLARDESLDLLQTLSARAGTPYDAAFCAALIAIAGDHPFFLQMIGDHAYERVAAGALPTPALADELLHGTFGDEAADHWRAAWASLTDAEQRVLALFAVRAASQPTLLRQLEAAALVTATSAGTPTLVGRGWQHFVSAQPVAGLLQVPPITIDPEQHVVLRRGQNLSLAPQLFDLLVYLVRHHERVVMRDELCLAVWQRNDASTFESLRTALRALRDTLGDDKDCIRTVRGQGYQFMINSR